jgi:hypothetical protein
MVFLTKKASNHMSSFGCRKCKKNIFTSKNNTRNGEITDIKEFVIKSNILHNDKYDYSKSKYINSKTHIKIICSIIQNNKKHGIFKQTPNSHLTGRGCPKYKYLSISKKLSKSCDTFILQANKIHKNKYIYDKINYTNARTKNIIFCKKHGLFKQFPNDHLSGNGCPKCKNENLSLTTENS